MRYEIWDMRYEVWGMRYEIWDMRYQVWDMKRFVCKSNEAVVIATITLEIHWSHQLIYIIVQYVNPGKSVLLLLFKKVGGVRLGESD